MSHKKNYQSGSYRFFHYFDFIDDFGLLIYSLYFVVFFLFLTVFLGTLSNYKSYLEWSNSLNQSAFFQTASNFLKDETDNKPFESFRKTPFPSLKEIPFEDFNNLFFLVKFSVQKQIEFFSLLTTKILNTELQLKTKNLNLKKTYLAKANILSLDKVPVSKFIESKKNFIQENSLFYVIKKGDCLINISKKFKVSLKELISFNQIKDPNIIIEGSYIRIPKK